MLLVAGHSWRHEPGLTRWSGALAAVLLLHAGAALGAMIAWEGIDPPAPPPAAIMLELAPAPVAPPAPQIAAPQEPAPQPPPPGLSQLVLPPVPDLPLTPPDIPAAEVELPKPEKQTKKELAEKPKPEKKKQKPEPRPEPEPEPKPAVAPKPETEPAQQPVPASAAPVQAAQRPAAAIAADTARRQAAEANWQGILLAHLERHKKYPRNARRAHAEGTAMLRFRMDRSGKVLSYALARSAGYDALDDEVLAMIERAQPLPALPPEVPDATVEIVVPVQFQLR